MRPRPLIAASAATLLLLSIIATIALLKLPPHTQLPIHWNAAGQPDSHAPVAVALFMPVLLTLALCLLFAVLPRLEPMQDRLRDSAPLLATCWAGLLALMLLVEIFIAAPAFHLALPSMLPLVGTGLLLILVGNALPKSRPGYFVGIRTPWTLNDTDNWVATHRLGARTMMAAGLLILLASCAPLGASTRTVLVFLACGMAVIPPFAYSWWRSRA